MNAMNARDNGSGRVMVRGGCGEGTVRASAKVVGSRVRWRRRWGDEEGEKVKIDG